MRCHDCLGFTELLVLQPVLSLLKRVVHLKQNADDKPQETPIQAGGLLCSVVPKMDRFERSDHKGTGALECFRRLSFKTGNP